MTDPETGFLAFKSGMEFLKKYFSGSDLDAVLLKISLTGDDFRKVSEILEIVALAAYPNRPFGVDGVKMFFTKDDDFVLFVVLPRKNQRTLGWNTQLGWVMGRYDAFFEHVKPLPSGSFKPAKLEIFGRGTGGNHGTHSRGPAPTDEGRASGGKRQSRRRRIPAVNGSHWFAVEGVG